MIAVGQPQPRLAASGWFERAFAATSGVLIAWLVFFIGLPLLGIAVVAGLSLAFAPAHVPAPAVLGSKQAAREYAVEFLSRQGIERLTENSTVTLKDGNWTVAGVAVKEGGAKTDVEVVLRVLQDGNTLRWRITDCTIGTRVIVRER